MKNILLLLMFFFMSLLGAKGVDGTVPSAEGVVMECVLQAEAPVGYVLPAVTSLPDESETYVDVESLAGQYRVVGRGQRPFSVQQLSFGKSSAYRAVRRHLEMLFYTTKSVYTSLPCQSWAIPSDHYIFGLRHILI